MNKKLCHLTKICLPMTMLLLALVSDAQTTPTATDSRADYLKTIKEQVALPPEVVSFFDFKERQALEIARQGGFELTSDLQDYFAAAKAGRLREAMARQPAFFKSVRDTNHPAYKSPLTQLAVDVSLAVGAFAESEPELVLALGRDLMKALPAGCVYFGGTDPGRGLPTILCKSPGEPVFVLTQYAFCDGRYLRYVGDMYGSRIRLPTTNEVQQCIDTIPKDQQAQNVMKVSGLIVKVIFDKNPDREFYYEESFPLDWMYPHLTPHGPVMKINRQPLAAISPDDLKADAAYWSAKVEQLKGNPKFRGDGYAGKTYAHLRCSIAGLYAWRAQSAKDDAERKKMSQAAESAFTQSLALYPAMPEAIWGCVNLLATQGRLDAALTVAKNGLAADPANEQIKTLVEQIQKQQPAAR